MKSKNTKISLAVIKRLPKYYRYLGDLLDDNVVRISSNELSEKMNITSSQIRQDLNNFGCFGVQGYGYNVQRLYNEIKKILGLDKAHNIVVVGGGNIGRAIINYSGFRKRGFNFTAIFEKDESIVGERFNGVEVISIKDLDDFLANNHVDIVALTVPSKIVYSIYKTVVNYDIKGIWNFTQLDLEENDNIKVESVHLTDSLMTLSYKIHEEDILKRYR